MFGRINNKVPKINQQINPSASTESRLLARGFAKMCLLTHGSLPLMQHYVRSFRTPVLKSVRQFRCLQARFLHCIPHGKPACGLLIGFTNLPIRDMHPLDNLSIFLLKYNSCHAGHTQSA
ncbi:hypothetical protein DXT99_25970 [Pontibacter diazotrophicus]|uniref:Uncharacterized protein n=1 Tax=Pontibacter diazotrophicus TaxID=1400979 RepID=A0A3D8L046_9BACT|nr:hypothetical protein DXT99_25970 [Pontibacter diazotrophicus]